MAEYALLDGYIIRRVTDFAVGIAKAQMPLGREQSLTWLPRSTCRDGDQLEIGEEDIEVAQWKADQENLDY